MERPERGRRNLKKKTAPSSALLARTIATAAGAGYAPKGPGTAGSLVALPILWFSRGWQSGSQIAFWVALLGASLWACRAWQQLPDARKGDDQRIVIDEVLGMGVTLAGRIPSGTGDLRSEAGVVVAGFVLFRLFDIWKPWPIRPVDRWSKDKADWAGAFGVIADDLAAGAAARALLALTRLLS